MWGSIVMVVTIFEFVGRHSSQNIPMTPFSIPKTLFTMECLAHILVGYFKVGVQSIKLDDSEFDTKLMR